MEGCFMFAVEASFLSGGGAPRGHIGSGGGFQKTL